MVKDFEFYIITKSIKKQKPDINLSNATFKESVERLQTAKFMLNKVKPKYILENAYESMREAADALLYKDGFKSYSHEASISYLKKKGFNESDLIKMDRFRKIRNDIKYYGGTADELDAKDALTLADSIISMVKKLI